eukprot:jgi/Hompol1/1053/HPOL_001163-RA
MNRSQGRGGNAGRGGSSGGRGGGGAGGGGGSGNKPRNGPVAEKPKKENILDLSKYSDKKIIVQFQGGRQVVGVLKGYDLLTNLVLDEAEEYIRDPQDPTIVTNERRKLGLLVSRGPAITLVMPYDGTEEIPNPFET